MLSNPLPPRGGGLGSGVMKSWLRMGPRGVSQFGVFVPHRPRHPLPTGAREIEAVARVIPVPLAPLGRGVRGEGAGLSTKRNRKEFRFTATPTFHHARLGGVVPARSGTSSSDALSLGFRPAPPRPPLRKGGKGICRFRRHSIARNKNTCLETVRPVRSIPTLHRPRRTLAGRDAWRGVVGGVRM